MSDSEIQISGALEAIKRAADAWQGGRSAFRDIERHLKLIFALADDAEVRLQGTYLLSHALGRYADGNRWRDAAGPRLHDAVERLDVALRRAGILPSGGGAI